MGIERNDIVIDHCAKSKSFRRFNPKYDRYDIFLHASWREHKIRSASIFFEI